MSHYGDVYNGIAVFINYRLKLFFLIFLPRALLSVFPFRLAFPSFFACSLYLSSSYPLFSFPLLFCYLSFHLFLSNPSFSPWLEGFFLALWASFPSHHRLWIWSFFSPCGFYSIFMMFGWGIHHWPLPPTASLTAHLYRYDIGTISAADMPI